MLRSLLFTLCLLLSGIYSDAAADDFDLGLGFGFVTVQNDDPFDLGLDLQLGYEISEVQNWHLGAQFHLINGFTSKGSVDEDKEYYPEDSTSMVYNSQALYLTARPKDWWLQFQLGMVHADYYTVDKDTSGLGPAFGFALVAPSEHFTLHILDFHHYWVNGESFNTYSVSMLILVYPRIPY